MARSELFEISRSRTLRSRRASAASSGTPFVGLRAPSGGERMPGGSKDVSMVGRSFGGFARRGIVAAFTCGDSGDELGSTSTVVADRRRDCWELTESIDDRLGDLWC